MLVLSFEVLDFGPPSSARMLSFSLIRTSNFSAVDSSNECDGDGSGGGLLGLFRAGLGEVLHQDAAKRASFRMRVGTVLANSCLVPVDLALRPVLGSCGLDRERRNEGLLAHGHCILKGRSGNSVISYHFD